MFERVLSFPFITRCLAMSYSHVVESSGVPQPDETRIANDGAPYTRAQFESYYQERADWYWQRSDRDRDSMGRLVLAVPPPPQEAFYNADDPGSIERRWRQAVEHITRGVYLPYVPNSCRVLLPEVEAFNRQLGGELTTQVVAKSAKKKKMKGPGDDCDSLEAIQADNARIAAREEAAAQSEKEKEAAATIAENEKAARAAKEKAVADEEAANKRKKRSAH